VLAQQKTEQQKLAAQAAAQHQAQIAAGQPTGQQPTGQQTGGAAHRWNGHGHPPSNAAEVDKPASGGGQ
jgi:hypothetical protein